MADRLPVDALVLVTAMVPAPGETPAEWWDTTGYAQAADAQTRRDGGLTGNADPSIAFYHDVPRHLAEQARTVSRSAAPTSSPTCSTATRPSSAQ